MPRQVLLIDDDRLQHRLTQAQFARFRGERFDLVFKQNYADGFSALMSGTYAACLLDYQLGTRDGLELIREAVAAGCRTPIIFLTAETGADVDIDAMNAGALDYLVKGEINPPALERSLRYALKLTETMDALRLLATRDELTGLLNRREFERLLGEEEERSLRFGRSMSVALLDLDHFKQINDRHGHAAGDAVLQHTAKVFRGAVRSIDRVARYGGEEFAVLLPETDHLGAMAAAQRLVTELAATKVTVAASVELQVTASGGVATGTGGTPLAYELVRVADERLYRAKANGRNRCVGAL